MCVGTGGKVLDFFQKWLQGRWLVWQLFVIPGRSCIRRQRQHIRQVYTGIALRAIDISGEIEDLGEKNHAIQVNALLVLQDVGEDGGAGRAIAFAEDEFGRVPAVVFGEKVNDKAGEGIRVLVDAPEGLFSILSDEAAEAGARHIDENQVAGIEQRVLVLDQLIGRARQVRIARGD